MIKFTGNQSGSKIMKHKMKKSIGDINKIINNDNSINKHKGKCKGKSKGERL